MGKPTDNEVKHSVEIIKKYCQMTDDCDECAIQSTCRGWDSAPETWESTKYMSVGVCKR